MKSKVRFERVDGVRYVYGSPEHKKALTTAVAWRLAQLQLSGIATQIRADANQTAFLARDLVFVQRDVQRVLYEELKSAIYVPIKSTVPRGVEHFVYKQKDYRGEARAAAHLDAQDGPSADVNYEEFPFPVTHVTASYSFTLEDMEKSAQSGVPLPRDKAEACAEIMARKMDAMMRTGVPEQGIPGFFNNPNVPVVTLTNGEWLTATDAEILGDLQQTEQAVITATRDRHQVTRLLAPTAYEGRLRTLKVTDSESTLAKYFFGKGSEGGNSRMLKELERWIALDDATGDDVGVDDPPQGIAYSPDPDVVHAEIPVPYEELPPQARGFGWVVNARAVFGGVIFRRPKGAAYLENLD